MVERTQAEPDQLNGAVVIEGMNGLPGGPELLELAAAGEQVELVGGVVRDLLLGRAPRELDVIVAGSAEAFAARIVSMIDGRLAAAGVRAHVEAHERFGTAVVRWPEGRVDVAARRAESYATPGALPEVRPGTAEQDLERRDFTINAIAVALVGAERGHLRSAPGALEDLAAGCLRVLHERSFRDDPTRLLRMARYSARLGFEPEQRTAALAAEAVAGGALASISRARFGAELRLALVEPDPVAALEALQRLGALAALDPAMALDPRLARAALSVLPEDPDAWPEVLLLASLLLPAESYDTTDYETRLRVLLDGLELPAAERERTVHSAILAPRIAERLQRAKSRSAVYEVAHGEPLEAVALAAALAEAADAPEAAEAARGWLVELRHIGLEIGGRDLLDAGMSAGPELGRRLRRALLRKLDGELPAGREAELAAALEEL